MKHVKRTRSNWCRSCAGAIVSLCTLGVAAAGWAQIEAAAPLTAADYANEPGLIEILWEHSPEVLDARAAAGIAASELLRAHTFPNPQADLTWGTVPIGASNPSGLNNRLDHVPNYTAGLSELIEIGKRGPRQAAMLADLERSRAQASVTLADRFFDLLESIGDIAENQLRVAVTIELVDASHELLELDRARTAKGDLAAIDFDRTEVEHLHLIAARDAAITDLEQARARCANLSARPCTAFDTTLATRTFLQSHVGAALPEVWSPEIERRRPDLAALAAILQAAEERKLLGERKLIPDVTARVGYTYDSFTIAGNQQHSLGVGVQVPLPVFDRGRPDIDAASATLLRAKQARATLAETGRQQLEASARRRQMLNSRLRAIDAALGKARGVRDALLAAQQRGGMSMIDVLLARRAYQELLLDGVNLLGDAFAATIEARKVAALFPPPQVKAEVITHE